jgi:hypothetical protein
MSKRRPVKVEYIRTVHYSTGRPHAKKNWPWPSIGAGVVAVVILPREPILAVLMCAVAIFLWRYHGRVRR